MFSNIANFTLLYRYKIISYLDIQLFVDYSDNTLQWFAHSYRKGIRPNKLYSMVELYGEQQKLFENVFRKESKIQVNEICDRIVNLRTFDIQINVLINNLYTISRRTNVSSRI